MARTNNTNFGEIAPLNSLVYDAAKALSAWNVQIAADTDRDLEGEDWSMKPSELLAPLQSTIRGDTIRGVNGEWDTDLQKYGSLQGLYEHYLTLRAKTTTRIGYYTHLFFHNDVLGDFAPVRLLAWWNRNLNDEIEYLERHHMVKKVYEFAAPIRGLHNSHPEKRYFGFELETPENIMHIVNEIAILQGRDIKEVPELTSYVISSAQKMAHDKHKNYNKCLEKALTDLYKSRRMVEHMVGIDLETTGLDHTTGWILNAGWLEYDSHDEQERIQNPQVNYYGVPKTRMKLGNPTVKVSGITTKQLKGLKPLDLDEEAQNKILQALLKDPYVAHNAMFEHSWLTLTVAGYAENYKKGNIKIIDSIKISRRLDPYDGKKDNRLETYAKHWNVLSESEHERHLGLEDSIIMVKAMCRNLRQVGL